MTFYVNLFKRSLYIDYLKLRAVVAKNLTDAIVFVAKL